MSSEYGSSYSLPQRDQEFENSLEWGFEIVTPPLPPYEDLEETSGYDTDSKASTRSRDYVCWTQEKRDRRRQKACLWVLLCLAFLAMLAVIVLLVTSPFSDNQEKTKSQIQSDYSTDFHNYLDNETQVDNSTDMVVIIEENFQPTGNTDNANAKEKNETDIISNPDFDQISSSTDDNDDEDEANVTPYPRPLGAKDIQATLEEQLEPYGLVIPPFDIYSYQSRAVQWVQMTALHGVAANSPERLVQRYALACIYFSTNGQPKYEPPVKSRAQALMEERYTYILAPNGLNHRRWVEESGWLVEDDECTWYGVTCNHTITSPTERPRVIKLDLSRNYLSGSLPKELILLKNSLETLNLNINPVYCCSDPSSPDNSWLGQLTNLKFLYTGKTFFDNYDGIPSSIGQLTNLVEYDCSETLYKGPLQGKTFENLTQLEYLSMGGNSFPSSIPLELARLPKLQYLYIQDADLTGDLSFLPGMPAISELWVDNNPDIRGTIPFDTGFVSTLTSLSVSNCSLMGTLPTELGKLPLEEFNCDDNKIIGSFKSQHSGKVWTCQNEA